MLCNDPAELNLPTMLKVRQHFDVPRAIDPETAVDSEFERIKDGLTLPDNARVAIGVGSRGISRLADVVRRVVQRLRAIGAEPFIIPAMGSHGGATAEGQIDILRHRGITDETCGAPVRATMAVVSLGRTECDIPLFIDKMANDSDGLVIVNRIKPHTNFIGKTESGLLKMMAIGLGNQTGAEYYHRMSLVRPQYEVISTAGREVIKRSPFLFGVGLVENQRHQLCDLKISGPREVERVESGQLKLARSLMPHLPVDAIDLLIVDEMGKEISGQGIDPNVVGRDCCTYGAVREKPMVGRIHVRKLTEKSAGSAVGIGMADFTLKSFIERIDFEATAINCLTACAPEVGKLPLAFENDLDALAAGLMSIRPFTREDLGLVYIKNTLELEGFYVSERYRHELQGKLNVEIVEKPLFLEFEAGMLTHPHFGA